MAAKPLAPLSKDEAKRFWSRVDRAGEHWIWRGKEMYWLQGHSRTPARIAWFASGRQLQANVGVTVSCGVRGCLRHLCLANKWANGLVVSGEPFRGMCSACHMERQDLAAIAQSKKTPTGAMVPSWSMALCPPCLVDGNKNVKAVLKRLEAA